VHGRGEPACPSEHNKLHDRLGQCVGKIARAAGIRKVFVMTHPYIMSVVRQLLHEAGDYDLTNLEVTEVPEIAGCQDVSPTFMSTVRGAAFRRFLSTTWLAVLHCTLQMKG
jgi:hypothetical protein